MLGAGGFPNSSVMEVRLKDEVERRLLPDLTLESSDTILIANNNTCTITSKGTLKSYERSTGNDTWPSWDIEQRMD